MDRGLSRRQLLRATFAGGIAGAGVRDASTSVAGRQESADSWPMYKSDAVNSGHDATVTGPTGDVAPRWNVEAQTQTEAETSAVVADGTVYIVTEGGSLYAVDPSDGSTNWSFTTEQRVYCAPAVDDGTVYVADTEAVYAVGADDGSFRWAKGISSGPTWSPVVADSVVYLTSHEATVAAFDANDGSELWAVERDAQIFSGPAVTDDSVYVTSLNGVVLALNAADGSERWTTSTDEPIPTSPAVAHDAVYAVGDEGKVHALETSDGSERWTFDTGTRAFASPAVTEETVSVGNHAGGLQSLNATDGSVRWVFETDGEIRSSPSVAGETLYVGTGGGIVHAVDLTSGDEQWGAAVGSPVSPFSSLAVANGIIYVPTEEDLFYALSGDQVETSTPTLSPTPTEAPATATTPTDPPVNDVSGAGQNGPLGFVPVTPGLVELLVGGGVLGAGLLGVRKFRGSDDGEATATTRDTSVADIWDEAESALSNATDAESDGDYTTALDEYSRGIRACERALENLPDGDERRGEIAAVLERAREERENLSQAHENRANLVERLETAETHFQTAVAAPASDKIVIPRERYRQARNAYDDALDTLNELDMTVLENGVSVSPDPTVDPPPERLNEFPGVHPGAQDALAEEGLETVTELRNAEAETLEVLREHDEIGDRLGVRLAGLSRWHGGDPVTFPDREAIERRRDLAQEAYQAHRQ